MNWQSIKSERQILAMRNGTKIRVKNVVRTAAEMYKVGGVLIKTDANEQHEKPYGIHTTQASCLLFEATEYEFLTI